MLEKKIQSAAESLGHDVAEFFGDVEALINRHFERSFPIDLESRFAVEQREWETRLGRLKEQVVSFEPTLDKTFEVDAGKIAASWDHLGVLDRVRDQLQVGTPDHQIIEP
ncbi:MAG: bacillithiol biosynthesis BshC [candidate division Zixibacteria bacterium]|nr:bacillithiol biosynthesis BshC [candidate division Zixibacteria bacterium]